MLLLLKFACVLSVVILYMPLLFVCKSVSTTVNKKPNSRRTNGYVEFCFDTEPERCKNFKFYCLTRSQFMSQNCKLTCQMCHPGDPVFDLSSKCAVELDKRQEELCILNEWTTVCPHTCKEYICADKEQDCASLASRNGCLLQHAYMTEKCMLSCAMCTPGNTVMDTTSECNPKQDLCRTDWEWRSICPHTCKSYIQSQPQGANTNQQVSVQAVQPQVQSGGAVQPQQPVVNYPALPTVQQLPTAAQTQLQQTGGAVQPQQPVANYPALPTIQQLPTAAQTQLQQTAQLQPQAQHPGLVIQPQLNSALQAGQVGSVVQPGTMQPQTPVAAAQQINPGIRTNQIQTETQIPPPINQEVQPGQVQPQVQQTLPQVNPAAQTSQNYPQVQQVQQAAPQVNPAIQPQALAVQQQAQQPYTLPGVSQYPNQAQVNTGQTHQPFLQQPQPGTVRGPTEREKGPEKSKSAKVTPAEETSQMGKMAKKKENKKNVSAKKTPEEEAGKEDKMVKKKGNKKHDSAKGTAANDKLKVDKMAEMEDKEKSDSAKETAVEEREKLDKMAKMEDNKKDDSTKWTATEERGNVDKMANKNEKKKKDDSQKELNVNLGGEAKNKNHKKTREYEDRAQVKESI
ncbi:mediator of RNA polymerase II transcription subunit 15 [Pocillopora verrucosa]|uniref:mediator of RNA polymerase II transcription subunit 15 n=1 Tax=Pocillopora verrucosa TaxID=203993 RepID=UPI0027972F74|nr:mediator of RNA polymerase II transcription subunit 15-like [Pocillopora verrucosa]